MFSLRRSVWLIAVGVLLTCAPAARSDAWVSRKRDASTGQLLWLRGKSTELLPQMLFCLIGLGLIDSLEQSGEAPVDCDAFVGSTDVAAGALIIRPIVV